MLKTHAHIGLVDLPAQLNRTLLKSYNQECIACLPNSEIECAPGRNGVLDGV